MVRIYSDSLFSFFFLNFRLESLYGTFINIDIIITLFRSSSIFFLDEIRSFRGKILKIIFLWKSLYP